MKAATQKKKKREHKKQSTSKNKTHQKKTAAGLHDWLLSYLIQYELN